MAELKGQQVQFIGSKSYADAINISNGDIHFTTDDNGSIVVNGKVYGTVDSNLMSTPTKGSLKEYIDGVANTASGNTSYALEQAKEYTDSKINALDVTDTAQDGKYVSAVSEANGKITVTRADLPVLSVSGGELATAVRPIKSITVNGHSIEVTPVEVKLATEANLSGHIQDDVKHITSYERAAWNDAAESINAFLADSYMGEQAIDTLKEIQEFLDSDTTGTSALTAKVNKSAKTVTLSNVDSVNWDVSYNGEYVEIEQTVTITANDDTTTDNTAYFRIPTTGVNKYGVIAIQQSGGLNVFDGFAYIDREYKMTYCSWADNAIDAKNAKNAEEADFAYYAQNAGGSSHTINVLGTIGLLYNTSENSTDQIKNGTLGQILVMGDTQPEWVSNLSDTVTIGGKDIATKDYVSQEISKVNQNTGSVSSYVEALSSEVQTISNDVDAIKSYLLWQ